VLILGGWSISTEVTEIAAIGIISCWIHIHIYNVKQEVLGRTNRLRHEGIAAGTYEPNSYLATMGDTQTHASNNLRLYPRGKSPPPPDIHWIGDWVGGPRAGLDEMEKSKLLLGLRPLGRPARNQSLYRLTIDVMDYKIHFSTSCICKTEILCVRTVG
jgi:hypothetical protein